MTQFVIRPVRPSDLESLLEFVNSAPDCLATVPRDKVRLEDKVDASVRSFFPRIKNPGSEHYLFVLEQSDTGRIAGISGLIGRVGGFDPFYTYEIRTERIAHKPMGIDKTVQILYLKTDHKGPSEIGSLLLDPANRGGGLGRLLSLCRFLFMHRFPERFDRQVVAELRGFIDEKGRSPFWEAVERPFFEVDFYEADRQCGLGGKDFIRDLMPAHPIYIPLLPPAAREVIGKVHQRSEPAMSILAQEGFAKVNEVDIFDAGPLMRAELDNIRAIRQCKTATVKRLVKDSEEEPTWILSNRSLDFRASYGWIKEEADGSVALPQSLASLLRISPGGAVDYVSAKDFSEKRTSP